MMSSMRRHHLRSTEYENKFILSKDDMTSIKEGSYGSLYLMTQDTYNKLEHEKC